MTTTQTRQTPATRRDGVSPGRVLLMMFSGGVAFVAGFYAGIVVLLSLVGFDGIAGSPFELATIPTGTLLAGLAVTLTAPDSGRVWRPTMATAVLIAVVATATVIGLDGDYATAIIVGGLGAVITTTAAAALSGSRAQR